jgi:hypothetical protein
MTWQRLARIVVAAVLVIFALVLYFAIGRRPATPPNPAIVGRSDPAAILEPRPAFHAGQRRDDRLRRQLMMPTESIPPARRDPGPVRREVVDGSRGDRRAPGVDFVRLGEVV